MTFEQNLINLVKQYELLYNPSHPSYNRTPLRTAAWTEIAEKLNSNRIVCKKKWKTLRDTYKKLLIKINAAGGVYKYHRRKWQYLSLIAFVNKYEPLYPKQEGKEWPIYVNTCVEVKPNTIPMMDNDSNKSEYEDGEKEFEAEYIDDVDLMEQEDPRNEPASTVGSPHQLHQQHQISWENYCSPGDDAENVKLIELTHSYAKSNQPKEKANEFSTKIVENVAGIKEPISSNEAECEEVEVLEEHLEEPTVDDVADTITTRSCSHYLAQLGAQIDALCVPSNVQIELEKRIEHLVHEVVEEYSSAEQFVDDIS